MTVFKTMASTVVTGELQKQVRALSLMLESGCSLSAMLDPEERTRSQQELGVGPSRKGP